MTTKPRRHRASKSSLFAAIALSLSLAACDDKAEGEGEATESELGDIDVLEGSVSDEMITLDRFGENPVTEEAGEAPNDTGPNDTGPNDTGPNDTGEAAAEPETPADDSEG